jgi:hypothetical protein
MVDAPIVETEEPVEDKKGPLQLAREALVSKWTSKLTKRYKECEPDFTQIRKNQRIARQGADDDWIKAGKYAVPVTNRHINMQVAQLYAKNPTTLAERLPKLDYKLWDGRQDSLQAAMSMAQMGDVASIQLIQEVLSVRQANLMKDRMARTLQICWDYYLNEQESNYKQQFKALVRRAKVSRVGYVKLGFQRLTEPNPEVVANITDVSDKLSRIEMLMEKAQAGQIEEHAAEAEELRLNLQDLQDQPDLVVREGPVLDFPKPNEVIVDPACRHLKTFAGARWVAQIYTMTCDEVYKYYGQKLKKGDFTGYSSRGLETSAVDNSHSDKDEEEYARVFEVWDRENRQMFVVADGHKDFLKEPHTPAVNIERFFPFFVLIFNEVEHDEELMPLSDVELAYPIQQEMNRSRQALREHRQAARPAYATGGQLDQNQKEKLANHDAHEIIEFPSLATGQKVSDILMGVPKAPIDPNLYETGSLMDDMLRSIGSSETQLGMAANGATATGESIAEQSRSVVQADHVDEIDDLLTEIAKAGAQLMLLNLSKEMVIEIAGEGAVWPDTPMSREEIAKELTLSVKAGSSGRPNSAAELAKLERAMPMLVQLPDINPRPLAEKYGELLDIDPQELIADGVPSITAMNAMLAGSSTNPGDNPTGNPESDPAQQGSEGNLNANNPQTMPPGGQPAYPTG